MPTYLTIKGCVHFELQWPTIIDRIDQVGWYTCETRLLSQPDNGLS